MEDKNKLITPYLPENLESLHKQEEKNRTRSILQVNSDSRLKDHMEFVQDSLNILFDLVTVYKHQTDDELTIQCLGIRLFNTVVSSVSLMLAGYYQNSLILQRDIIETGFLLDYFSADPSKISMWKSAGDEERKQKFKPSVIREALDKRDSFKERKRGQVYHKLCEYAAHPTYKGFKLVAPGGLGQIGPFYDERYLRAVLEELILRIPFLTLVYLEHFKRLPSDLLKAQVKFLLKLKTWCERYLNLDFKNVDMQSAEKILEFL